MTEHGKEKKNTNNSQVCNEDLFTPLLPPPGDNILDSLKQLTLNTNWNPPKYRLSAQEIVGSIPGIAFKQKILKIYFGINEIVEIRNYTIICRKCFNLIY